VNPAVTVRPPLKAVAAALGALIAGHPHQVIVREVMADFEVDQSTAEQCVEIAQRMRAPDADPAAGS